jgi:hypothetical protein
MRLGWRPTKAKRKLLPSQLRPPDHGPSACKHHCIGSSPCVPQRRPQPISPACPQLAIYLQPPPGPRPCEHAAPVHLPARARCGVAAVHSVPLPPAPCTPAACSGHQAPALVDALGIPWLLARVCRRNTAALHSPPTRHQAPIRVRGHRPWSRLSTPCRCGMRHATAYRVRRAARTLIRVMQAPPLFRPCVFCPCIQAAEPAGCPVRARAPLRPCTEPGGCPVRAWPCPAP